MVGVAAPVPFGREQTWIDGRTKGIENPMHLSRVLVP